MSIAIIDYIRMYMTDMAEQCFDHKIEFLKSTLLLGVVQITSVFKHILLGSLLTRKRHLRFSVYLAPWNKIALNILAT